MKCNKFSRFVGKPPDVEAMTAVFQLFVRFVVRPHWPTISR
ncbi:MAG: hypothetical protein ABI398_02165 [Devosia sp.]